MYLHATAGMGIEEFAQNLIEVRQHIEVNGVFNDIYLSVDKDTTPEEIIQQYYSKTSGDNEN